MALTKLRGDVENPLSIMMGCKDWALKTVCHSEEEVQYYELCYLRRSKKAAKEFELWNQGFWASLEVDKKPIKTRLNYITDSCVVNILNSKCFYGHSTIRGSTFVLPSF